MSISFELHSSCAIELFRLRAARRANVMGHPSLLPSSSSRRQAKPNGRNAHAALSFTAEGPEKRPPSNPLTISGV